MQKINTILISKEISNREFIAQRLKQIAFIQLVGSYNTFLESFHSISDHNIKLILIDEPHDTVQDILNSIEGVKPVIVRVTFEEKLNSLDVSNLHISFSVSDYKHSIELIKNIINQLESSTEHFSDIQEVGSDFLFVRTNHSLVKIYFRKIFYIKAMENFVQIVTENGTFMTLMTLKNMLSQLPAKHFIQVHRSYVVNIDEIKLLEKNTVNIHKYEIPIGGAYKTKLNELLSIKSKNK